MEEPQTNSAPSDSEHYRDMASKLRNWLVNSVSPARAKSYLTLPRNTSEEPIACDRGITERDRTGSGVGRDQRAPRYLRDSATLRYFHPGACARRTSNARLGELATCRRSNCMPTRHSTRWPMPGSSRPTSTASQLAEETR
jgi:hypothetical protein